MKINKLSIFCVLLPLITSCCKSMSVEVSNPHDFDRHPEMVELSLKDVAEQLSVNEEDIIVKDSEGNEVAYQLTHDGKLIFQVQLDAKETIAYRIFKGEAKEYETVVFGKQYPERADDFVWENDIVGFRAYGPALQARGEKGFGYDLFAKRDTKHPFLANLYDRALGERTKAIYQELLKVDEKKAEDYKLDSMTLHIDKGNGMDVYAVGPTLGAGVTALMVDNEVIFPWCYKDYEILDYGPLRISFKLTFNPVVIGADENVVETRVITLDAGSHLNHTSVVYENLSSSKELVAGIVLRDKEGKEVSDVEQGYIAYPAPSMNFDYRNPDIDNGIHFVGHVYPDNVKDVKSIYYSDKESKELRGGSAGHIMAFSDYNPGDQFNYFWGFGWSHSEMKTYDQWIKYLDIFSKMVKNPLTVTLK